MVMREGKPVVWLFLYIRYLKRERDKQDAHVIAGKKKILKKDVVDKNRGFASEVFKPDRDRLKARQPRI